MERKETKECMARKGNCLQDRKQFLSYIFKILLMDSLMERPSLMLVVLSAIYSTHFILNFRTKTKPVESAKFSFYLEQAPRLPQGRNLDDF